jgi:hypothetical protein
LVNVGDHAGQQSGSEAGAAVIELALVDGVGECLGQADQHAAVSHPILREATSLPEIISMRVEGWRVD